VLVGNYPGRAQSFTTRKEALDRPKVVGYPSKAVGLFVPDTLIFRSDSNGEDLEGFAGAGLYDSITMDPTQVRVPWPTLPPNTGEYRAQPRASHLTGRRLHIYALTYCYSRRDGTHGTRVRRSTR
jgi:hypothetical protein